MLQDGYRLAVGVMLINAMGKIYGFQRIDYPDTWQCPEGGMEEGEEAQTAALREMEEEVGLHQDDIELLAVSKDFIRYDVPDLVRDGFRMKGQAKKFFLYRVTNSQPSFNLANDAHPEFQAMQLFTISELLQVVPKFKEKLYEQVLAEFAEYLAN